MKTTQETIEEVKALSEHNQKLSGRLFAVLKPIEPYDDVDFAEVSKTLNMEVKFFPDIKTIYLERAKG